MSFITIFYILMIRDSINQHISWRKHAAGHSDRFASKRFLRESREDIIIRGEDDEIAAS